MRGALLRMSTPPSGTRRPTPAPPPGARHLERPQAQQEQAPAARAIPMRRMRGYRGQIFACPSLQATIEGEIAQEPEKHANENHRRVAAIIEKDGEILAHIENVDWLPADMKVVDALEKRGEL